MSASYRVKSMVYRMLCLACALGSLMCLGNLFAAFLPAVGSTFVLAVLTRLFYLQSLRAERAGQRAARRHSRRMARRPAPAAVRQPAFTASCSAELLRTA
ncbi:MAG: hypothetical protein IJ484_05140 [Oscillospiraceae bacterium]|nr:hypothetical protein [Oscillospiraceae bacterium]